MASNASASSSGAGASPSHLPAAGTSSPVLSSGEFVSKESALSAGGAGARRSSYDFTQADSLAMLDHPSIARGGTGAAGSSGGAFSSPRLGPPSRLFHANTMRSMPQSTQLPAPALTGSASVGSHSRSLATHISDASDSKNDAGTDASTRHGRADSHSLQRPSMHRAATAAPHSHSLTEEYRQLGTGASVHFEDVLREKTTYQPDSGSASARPAALRITVTGELLDGKKRVAIKDAAPPRARRNTREVEADEKEGSVKTFGNVEEFFRDEERRRLKYDAAAAAHAAAQDALEAKQAESAGTGASSPTASSSSSGSGSAAVREPLAQTPLWISVEDADDETTELIGRYFGLHPLTIEDSQSKGIREKLEVFPEYLFLVFHALEEAHTHAQRPAAQMNDLTSELMKTTPLKMIVFPSLVLSFHKGGLGAVVTVRKQLDKLYRNRVLNTAWLIHGLLDVVSDSLMPVVDTACKLSDDMEDLIYIINPGRESHRDVLKRMGFIARRLTFLRQRLWSKRDILTSLIEKDWQFFLTGVKVPYLRDIYDHLVIMLHKLDSAIEVIVTLQNTYLAVVSIDVAAVSNDGNKAMKTLSAAATILLPLSLIASLMGMNVMVPFNTDTDVITFRDLLPFSTICLLMVCISFYLYSYFKRKQYL